MCNAKRRLEWCEAPPVDSGAVELCSLDHASHMDGTAVKFGGGGIRVWVGSGSGPGPLVPGKGGVNAAAHKDVLHGSTRFYTVWQFGEEPFPVPDP